MNISEEDRKRYRQASKEERESALNFYGSFREGLLEKRKVYFDRYQKAMLDKRSNENSIDECEANINFLNHLKNT